MCAPAPSASPPDPRRSTTVTSPAPAAELQRAGAPYSSTPAAGSPRAGAAAFNVLAQGRLRVSLGQHADAGVKPEQQDFHGAVVPDDAMLEAKGVALAIADGVSSSEVSAEASQYAVGGFLADYYCTSDAWSVKTSADRVITASNAWLHAQTRRGPGRYEQDRGHVCTFSALVLKARTAHIFHIGDTRIGRLAGQSIEPLTTDHRVTSAGGQSYLARALGVQERIEIDHHSVPVDVGDVFVLTTDGVHEFVESADVARAVLQHADDLDAAARSLVELALRNGSNDNLTVQLLRVDALPDRDATEQLQQAAVLPLPPVLQPRMVFEGCTILRELHVSHRSHIHLAKVEATGELLVIKTPSVDLRDEPGYRERFLLEEWVARRIDSPHVLKPRETGTTREHLCTMFEYIEGQTLAQWMTDHPQPTIAAVRDIVDQIALGLRAFHRKEMLYQDLRPENVMIDATGTVKIIDFGSVSVAGLSEAAGGTAESHEILGTVQFTAPEYFIGEGGTPQSDLYALGVLTYQLLSGGLPFGADAMRVRTRRDAQALRYRPLQDPARDLPPWLDAVLEKATHPDPAKRYGALSEFTHELRHPPASFLRRQRAPMLERDPARFWQAVSLVLFILVLLLARALLARGA